MEDAVIHSVPGDIIVNLGQFRSSTLLNPYRDCHPFHELSLTECAKLGYRQKKKVESEVAADVQSDVDVSGN